jgi:hypothetical protein
MAERLLRKLKGDDKAPLPKWWIEGLPLVKHPFGDQSKDAVAISAGYGFYSAKAEGKCQ